MLLVVDGSNLLFQMFYGMPARIVNREGRGIQGTLGFIGALRKIIRMVEPSHIAVVFDGEGQNARTELDENYKANRPDYSQVPEEETPFSQLPDIYRALDLMGISHRETVDCEADDWIAGYALTWDGDVVISSQDSDFFQLIGPKVRILRYRGEKTILCDSNWLRATLGIDPEQYAAFKALVGDPADNIPGVPGIGPKTAARLLHQFGKLEEILNQAEQISGPAVRQAVVEHRDRLEINHRLIRLQAGAKLPFSPEELVYMDCRLSTSQILAAAGIR